MSEFARLRAFVLWFISEPKQELGAPAPWSVELAGNVIDRVRNIGRNKPIYPIYRFYRWGPILFLPAEIDFMNIFYTKK